MTFLYKGKKTKWRKNKNILYKETCLFFIYIFLALTNKNKTSFTNENLYSKPISVLRKRQVFIKFPIETNRK